ncbi:MAG TPA: biotin/lipoate--protein ligase family protein [Acetobacteraceae bacterium]|nr:biotin/lipoate--protein ligase family protein [Acetobacteraceae bacterium]
MQAGSILLELPPGLRAQAGDPDPWARALDAAARGDEPGAVFWSGSAGRCRAAYLFAPDRPLGTGALLDLGLLALFDALAALAPPQVPLAIARPAGLLVDGGRVASVCAALGPGAVPDWAALGLEVALDLQRAAPGETPGETCLAEEGFGALTAPDLLAQTSRHLLLWLDTWHDEGEAALARAVGRRA